MPRLQDLGTLTLDQVLAHRSNGRCALTEQGAAAIAAADVVMLTYAGGRPCIKGWPLLRNFLKGDERLDGLQCLVIEAVQASPLEIYALCQAAGAAEQPLTQGE